MELSVLSNILLELKSESMKVSLNPSKYNLKSLMNKYDMLFLGKDFNCIYTNELTRAINNIFNIPVTEEEVNAHIPIVCQALHMSYEAMIGVSDISKPNPKLACYMVTL